MKPPERGCTAAISPRRTARRGRLVLPFFTEQGGAILGLVGKVRAEYFEFMSAAKVIEEIDELPPEEQAKVIQHALKLARKRQLSADELGELADQLAKSKDPAEIIRLKSAMTRGFYGE